MNRAETLYYFYYYFFYVLSEAAPSKWWSETKASLAISVLEISLFFSCLFFIETLLKFKLWFMSNPFIVILPVCIGILFMNYYLFIYKNKWLDITKTIERWPRKKKNIGYLLSSLLTVLVILTLVLSIYLLSVADWSEIK